MYYNEVMHPLSIFPQLFFLSLIAPLLLRLGVGILLILLGKERHKKTYNWSVFIYIISGVLLVLGLYTQLAAIVGILVIGFDLYMDRKSGTVSMDRKILCVITIVILLSLLFTGPGLFAFDLPL